MGVVRHVYIVGRSLHIFFFQDRKNDTGKLGRSRHPQWNLIHEKSDLMRRRFRKALRLLGSHIYTVFPNVRHAFELDTLPKHNLRT